MADTTGALMPLDFGDSSQQPLAHRLRPRQLDEILGQQQLLGAGKPLRQAIEPATPAA